MKITQKIAITYIRSQFRVLAAISPVKAASRAFTLFCTPLHKSRKKPGLIFNDATSLQINIPGYTIRGFGWNMGASHTILILHGFSSCAYNFERYIQAFAKQGYRVLAFDAPAHGTSSGKTVNAVQYKDTILEIHRCYGPFHGAMAHSFGGIALALAMEELPHTPATKLVFIAPATETVSAVSHAFGMLRLQKTAVQAAFHQIIYNLSGKPTEWFSIRRAAYQLKASILWLHDEEDDITPAADAKMVQADNHPHIQFVFTKGLGHQKIYRDAGVKEQVIAFLQPA